MTFLEIIGLWPSVLDLAQDLGLPAKNVRRWQDIGSIPAEWFVAVDKAAQARGFRQVTVQTMSTAAHDRRLRKLALEAANDPLPSEEAA